MRRISLFGLSAVALLALGACDKCGGAKQEEAPEAAPMGDEAPVAPEAPAAEAPSADAAAPAGAPVAEAPAEAAAH